MLAAQQIRRRHAGDARADHRHAAHELASRFAVRQPDAAQLARDAQPIEDAQHVVREIHLPPAIPWRQAYMKRWWLLCQPSPSVTSASTKLLRLSSAVSNRRVPQTCASELMQNVAWYRHHRGQHVAPQEGARRRRTQVNRRTQQRGRHPMIAVKPSQLGKFREIANEARFIVVVVVGDDPTDVRPPEASQPRRVDIRLLVGMTMMNRGGAPPTRAHSSGPNSVPLPPAQTGESGSACRNDG